MSLCYLEQYARLKPYGKNCVIVRSLFLSQYRCVTDGRTDIRTDTLPMPISRDTTKSIDQTL